MLFHDKTAYRAAMPLKGPLLGLDVGTKTLGLAECDALWRVASPLKTLHRTKWKADIQVLEKIVQTHDIQGFVVGWPLLMNGDEGPRCHSTLQVARNLLERIPKPCLLWDERLSTQACENVLEKKADLTRQKRAKVIDAVAAAWILGSALDAMRYLEND